jgi:hypothetical protein
MNILVALISFVAVVFTVSSSRVPVEVRLTPTAAISSGILAIFVIVTSLLALLRYPKVRLPALGAALLFFGILLLQSLFLLIHPSNDLPVGSPPKLGANVIRNAIEISLNIWVFLSVKVADYPRAVNPPT